MHWFLFMAFTSANVIGCCYLILEDLFVCLFIVFFNCYLPDWGA